jgi:hypothetical protein
MYEDSFSLWILTNICCYLFSWWLPFWLGWDGISMQFWLVFPLWLRMLTISSCVYHSFELLRTVQFICHLLIGLFVPLVFNFLSSLYILDINLYPLNSWQRFSVIQWLISSFWFLFFFFQDWNLNSWIPAFTAGTL